MNQFFVDRAPASLGNLERTPQGGYKAPAKLARTGVMLYSADALRKQGLPIPKDKFPSGSMVRVYTPPEVLKEAMDTLRACPAPVTNEHPARMVTTQNFRQVTCGNHIDSTLEFDGTYLSADLALQDAQLLADVDRGKREVSMGYYADTVFEGGTTPEGETYDARRARIVYNHIAIVEAGRAGAQVCLALDSDEIPNQEEEPSVKLKINGVEVDASEAQAAIDALEGRLTAVTSERDTARTELETAQASLAEAVSDAAIDAKLAERDAKRKADEGKAKRLQAVKDAFPNVDLTGKSDDYVAAMFDALEAAKAADPDGRKRLKGEIKDARDERPVEDKPKLSAREIMVRRQRGEKV
jgi:hypothetical protein